MNNYVIAFLVGSAGFLAYYYFSRGKKLKNIFDRKTVIDNSKKSYRRPTNDEIDELLKNPITVSSLKPQLVKGIDAVIVGAGTGGLATAAILSKLGKKVLVLEQHSRAGGCLSSFILKGNDNNIYEYDVGVHYIPAMSHESWLRYFLDAISDGEILWNEMDDHFDNIIWGKTPKDYFRYSWISNKKRMLNGLIQDFPDEEKPLREYFDLMNKSDDMGELMIMLKIFPVFLVKLMKSLGIFRCFFSKFMMLIETSANDYIDSHFKSKELRAILKYGWGLLATLPDVMPMLMQLNISDAYMEGVSFPVGGPICMAYALTKVVEKNGGKVFTNASVKEILINSGNVVGVRLDKSDIVIPTKLVISSAGFYNTYNSLISPDTIQNTNIPALLKDYQQEKMEFFCVFIGLKGTCEDLGLSNKNYWYYPSFDFVGEYNEWFNHDSMNTNTIPGFFFTFPSAKDPLWNNTYPDRSTCQIILFVKSSWFSEWKDEKIRHRGEEYEELKNSLAQKIWKKLLEFFPQLADKVTLFNVGTPLTSEYYLRHAYGHACGLDHSMKSRFTIDRIGIDYRAETPVSGLYLAGQDIITAGVAESLLSGVLVASKIYGSNLFGKCISEYSNALKEGWKVNKLPNSTHNETKN